MVPQADVAPPQAVSIRRGRRTSDPAAGATIPQGLADALRHLDVEVRTDAATRAAYATDASNYRHLPLAVVRPRTAEALHQAVVACAAAGTAIALRGGGTSVAGNSIGPGVVFDTSTHLDRVVSIDPEARTAVVEPGVVLDDLQRAAAPHGLRFGPDPSTHARCTIGGMIGNNACGSRSLAWGRTVDNVIALTVALTDGTLLRVGPHGVEPVRPADQEAAERITSQLDALVGQHAELIETHLGGSFTRRTSGYLLEQLLPGNGGNPARALVGTEGSCAVVLSAEVRLVPLPTHVAVVAVGFVDIVAAAAGAASLVDPDHGLDDLELQAVEGFDHRIIAALRRAGRPVPEALPEGRGWLLVEVAGTDAAQARARAEAVAAHFPPGTTRVVTAADERAVLWRIREEGAGLATRLPDGSEAWPGWEDASVPPSHLADYLTEFRALLDRHGLDAGIFGHFGEGCVHARISFPFDRPEGQAVFRAFMEDAADLVVAHGGSLSGEHGDGQARSELLDRMYPAEMLELFTRFRGMWEPTGTLGTGTIVDPRPLDGDLRPTRASLGLDTVFSYPHDGGDLTSAARRCVGVGKCRDTSSGPMCPSFMATGDELDSTRGRARVLHEMLTGGFDEAGWRSTEVAEALDLCLSCKACKTDCPVNVDIATYKAEFLHHHWRRRLRPRSHYATGWLPLALRFGTRVPKLVNRVSGNRWLARALAWAGGMDRRRGIPRLAERPLLRRPALRAAQDRWRNAPGDPNAVVLFADTFTSGFDPDIWQDAQAALAAAGAEVVTPDRSVCCGLTWISTGQLGQAKRVLRRTLDALDPVLDGTTPIVVLEPSCASALATDAAELLADDPRAARLAAQVTTFARWWQTNADHVPLAASPATAVTQVHCHQRATFGTAADDELRRRLGMDTVVSEAACCGLAGNFGVEDGHYDVSVACAERALLPGLRDHEPDVVIADGFSCRFQVDDLAGYSSLHLAQAVRAAVDSAAAPAGPPRAPGSEGPGGSDPDGPTAP